MEGPSGTTRFIQVDFMFRFISSYFSLSSPFVPFLPPNLSVSFASSFVT